MKVGKSITLSRLFVCKCIKGYQGLLLSVYIYGRIETNYPFIIKLHITRTTNERDVIIITIIKGNKYERVMR